MSLCIGVGGGSEFLAIYRHDSLPIIDGPQNASIFRSFTRKYCDNFKLNKFNQAGRGSAVISFDYLMLAYARTATALDVRRSGESQPAALINSINRKCAFVLIQINDMNGGLRQHLK